jgi:hypothetical protein
MALSPAQVGWDQFYPLGYKDPALCVERKIFPITDFFDDGLTPDRIEIEFDFQSVIEQGHIDNIRGVFLTLAFNSTDPSFPVPTDSLELIETRTNQVWQVMASHYLWAPVWVTKPPKFIARQIIGAESNGPFKITFANFDVSPAGF